MNPYVAGAGLAVMAALVIASLAALVLVVWRRHRDGRRLLRHICGVCYDYIETNEDAVVNKCWGGFDHAACWTRR